MPELPEVEAIRRGLEPDLVGRSIARVRQSWGRSTAPQTPAWFRSHVEGQKISGTGRIGKYLKIHFASGDTLVIHLRMTGQLRVTPEAGRHVSAETPVRYERLHFELDNASCLRFFDQRKFGRAWLVTAGEGRNFKSLARLGCDALDPAFTAARFQTLLCVRRRQIKPLLLDQSVIAGLGNIYVDEALFCSGIHPLSISQSVPAARLKQLWKAMRDVLTESIRYQGTTFRDYRTARGERGGFFERLQVYGRGGKACVNCGKKILKLRVAQRGTHVCARCQRKFA